MDFAITTVRHGSAVVLELSGELELRAAAQLRPRLTELLEQRTPTVVDLAEVGFVDSAGLHALGDWQLAAEGAGVPVAMSGPGPRVLRLLQITSLDTRVPTFATSADAVAALDG